jgi:hypothetical protein
MSGEVPNISFPDAVWGVTIKVILVAGYGSGELVQLITFCSSAGVVKTPRSFFPSFVNPTNWLLTFTIFEAENTALLFQSRQVVTVP